MLMLSADIRKFFEDKNPTLEGGLEIQARFTSSELLKQLGSEYSSEVSRLNRSGSHIYDVLDEELMYKYFNTLVWMRVAYINNEKTFSPYREVAQFVAVPVLVYQLIISIGRVHDVEWNIHITPRYTTDGDDLLSVDELTQVSSLLRGLENNGLKQVIGMPNDKQGDFEFMVMNHINNRITSHRVSHPVYGFLAAFLESTGSRAIYDQVQRIHYGTLIDYRARLAHLLPTINGGTRD
jgi:hypothetical protein